MVIVVCALAQLIRALDTQAALGAVPGAPLPATLVLAKLVIEVPVVTGGAVVLMVKLAVAPAAIPPAGKFNVQVNSAPAVDKGVQLTEVTPAPTVVETATTPAGNWSCTMTDVPVASEPLLVKLKV